MKLTIPITFLLLIGSITATSQTGTAGYIPKFITSTTIGNSTINENATGVGIGTAASIYKLDINGTARVNGTFILRGTQQSPNYILANEGADNSTLLIKAGSTAGVYSQIEVSGN